MKKQRWEESERREEKRRRKKIKKEKESERIRKSQKESERVRKSQKKEDADARKGRKVAKHRVFPMICGSGGSKSRPAPAGQMRDEKLHAVAARSTFRSQKCTKHTILGPLLEVERSKKRMPLWREAHFEVKSIKKTDGLGSLLQVETSKKRAPLWGKARFEVKMLKTLHARTSSGRSDGVSRGRRAGLCTVSKVRKKREGFVAFPKINDGRRGAFEEDLQRCIFPRQAQYKRHVHQVRALIS